MAGGDRELVELARRGDAAGELFSRYRRAARAAAFGVTGALASAEDAVAEALRQALAGLDSHRDPDRFGSWLRTIVVRKEGASGSGFQIPFRTVQNISILEFPAVARQSLVGLCLIDNDPE